MRRNKKDRQKKLKDIIEVNPFITDEDLANQLSVSIQTIRLDRLELSIPELRERIKNVATQQLEDVKSLRVDEIIGEVIDIQLNDSAISIFDVKQEHVFSRNGIARGHHLFAQANSLAVAVINDDLALTAKSNLVFLKPAKLGDRVVAKAKIIEDEPETRRKTVEVNGFVENEHIFEGTFEMYHRSQH
jgi:acyl-coenzyme A thioesterase PaaI-like protein